MDYLFFQQHRRGLRYLATISLFLALAACESSSSPTNSPNGAQPAAVSPATTSSLALSSQDTSIAAPDATQNADKPTRQINANTLLAPGLLVRYQSVPDATTTIGHDPCEQKIAFSIHWSGNILFQDTTDGCVYDPSLVDAGIRTVYPLWVPTGPKSGELLIVLNNRPSKDLARRFFIQNQRVVKIDTLLTFDGPARDTDGDGKREYSGIQDYGEEWDDEQGRHRRSYNPLLYYEVRSTGLVLDSTLTRRQAQAQYGGFYGFKYSDEPVLVVK